MAIGPRLTSRSEVEDPPGLEGRELAEPVRLAWRYIYHPMSSHIGNQRADQPSHRGCDRNADFPGFANPDDLAPNSWTAAPQRGRRGCRATVKNTAACCSWAR